MSNSYFPGAPVDSCTVLNLMGIGRSQEIVAQACMKRHIWSFILLIMQII